MSRATEEEQEQVRKSVLQAVINTEATIDLLRESYDIIALKRTSDIIVAQELSLKELKDLYNSIG